MKRFLTKECNYKEVVPRTPLIHTVSVDFIKSRVVASIPGFFFCMWYAAKKRYLANNVLGISSHIRGIEMLSLGLLKTGAILLLLFPTTDAALPSSMVTIGDTVIPGIFVALVLCIAVPRGSKNRVFNCAFSRYTVGLTVIIIIMNWFQAAQGGQPALLYVASGVIGFVAVHCLWNGEVKQLMGKVWDWNMYGIKPKKFPRWVLHIANEYVDGGGDDATAPPEDCGDGPEDGSSTGSDDDDSQDDRGTASEDSDDEIVPCGPRAVQLLTICANFRIHAIILYDGRVGRCVYRECKGEVQEEGMVDLVPIGPPRILEAYGFLALEVFTADDEGSCTGPCIKEEYDVSDNYEVEEYTQTIYGGGPGHKLEITYLVIPNAIETNVEVRLKLKDLGSRSCAVYGKIKASTTDYGNKSIHLFSCERGRSLPFPSGSTSILPLSPSVIALPYRRELKLHIELDLGVITTCDSQEEHKNLKFSLDFTPGTMSQEREVDDDQVEVNITWYPEI